MKRLLCIIPDQKDATSFYRAMGPLTELRRRMGTFEMTVNPMHVHWAELKAHDVVFMQRPFNIAHLQCLNMAHDNRRPVWVDYDDNLFNVPPCNQTFPQYSTPEAHQTMATIIASADRITVSTFALQRFMVSMLKRVGEKNPGNSLNLDPSKIVLVPNAYDDDLMHDLTYDGEKQQTIVAWRGSATHDKDMMIYTDAMRKVISTHRHWTYAFVGSPFWHTMEQLISIPDLQDTSIVQHAGADIPAYLEQLRKMRPAIMQVPLEDSMFNHCKSNIAWLEVTHAGGVVLGPNFDEWKRPGIINYDSPVDYADKLDRFIRGEFDGQELWRRSRDFIASELRLRRVNQLRELMLRDLLETKL